jgi:hypothetical protein
MLLKRGYALIAVLVVVVLLALAVPSCRSTRPAPMGAGSPGKPLTSFTTADFSGSGICAKCHSDLQDQAGNDRSIDTHWRSTMMANAARDPYFLAKVSSEVVHNPGLREVIEEKCSVCHMPMAHTQAEVDGQTVAMLEPGFLDPDHQLHEAAMDGVACTLCHQIEDRDLGTDKTFSGEFHIDTTTTRPDLLTFGPFPEPMQGLMRDMCGFTPVHGDQVLDAGLCGACHTLYTPYLDAQGNVLGEFPEQTPYLEWKHSAYSSGSERLTCQGCHMPEAIGEGRISNRPRLGLLQPRFPFAEHHFVGGNAFMINVLKANVDELGLTCSTEQLDGTLGRILNQLRNNTVELAIADAELAGDTLSLRLRLQNKAGHKLPAGFPSRRAWLHVKVVDANGQVVFESGMPQVDGTIVGADADEDAAAYERHYDVISTAEEVQIYEAVMHDVDDRETYTLLQAAGYLKDNRLLPRGFDKETAGEDFATKGLAAVDKSFLGGVDEVTYQVDARGHSGPFEVLVELLYQSISYGFIRDIKQYDTDQVKAFLGYYEEADKMPIVIATLEETVG